MTRIALLLTGLMICASQAQANEEPDFQRFSAVTDFDANLSSSVWSATRSLDKKGALAQSRLLVRAKSKPAPNITLVADGYARYIHGFSENIGGDIAVLREGYISLRQGPATWRIGSQIINWGRMDAINPTDNVSAQDYTLLGASDAEQKLGVPSASTRYRMGDSSVEVVWQPIFKASQIPLPALSGLSYSHHRPSSTNGDIGVRFDTSGAQLSWSASYFSGHSRKPSPRLSIGRVAQGVLDMDHPKVGIYGFDAEYVAGRWILRSEIAYNRFAKSGSNAIASKESFFHGVMGAERNFGSTSAFIQMGVRRGYDFINPYAVHPDLRPLALINAVINDEVHRTLLSTGAGINFTSTDLRWQARLEVLTNLAIRDLALRPRLRYALNDNLSIWSGADYFSGPSTAPLGRLERNNAVFIGIDYALLNEVR